MRAQRLLTVLAASLILTHNIFITEEPTSLGDIPTCISDVKNVISNVRSCFSSHYAIGDDLTAARDTITAGKNCYSALKEAKSEACRSAISTFFNVGETDARGLIARHTISDARTALSNIFHAAENVERHCS